MKAPAYLTYEVSDTSVVNATLQQRCKTYELAVSDLEKVFTRDTPFEYLGDYYLYRGKQIPFYVIDFYSFPIHQTMLYPTYIRGEQPEHLNILYISESVVICETNELIESFKEDAFIRSERLYFDLTGSDLPYSIKPVVADNVKIIRSNKPVKHITERYIASMYRRYASSLGIPEEVTNISCGKIVNVIGQYLSFEEAKEADRLIDLKVARKVAHTFNIDVGDINVFTDAFIINCLKNYNRSDLYKIVENYNNKICE